MVVLLPDIFIALYNIMCMYEGHILWECALLYYSIMLILCIQVSCAIIWVSYDLITFANC